MNPIKKKITALIHLFLFLVCLSFSSGISSESLEELESRLSNSTGLARVELLNKISEQYNGKSFEKMRAHAAEALQILEKESLSGDARTISLQKSKAYQNLGWSYYSEGDYASAEKNLELAEATFSLTKDLQDRANIFNLFGALYLKKNEFDRAKEYYETSLEIFLELGDKEGIPKIYNNLGVIYKKKADYQKALEYYLLALKIHEEADNKNMLASSYNNVAILYKQLNKNDLALKYYEKSMQLNKDTGNKKGLAISYNNIAALYSDENKLEPALENYNLSLQLRKELRDKEGIAMLLKNIADIKKKSGKYAEAIDLLEQVIVIRKELRADELFLDVYNLLLETYILMNQYSKASVYLQLGEKELPKSNDKEAVIQFYKNASLFKEKTGKYKESLEYFRKYTELEKNIYNSTLYEQFALMQTRYETEKKEKENEILKKKTEIQRLTLQKQSIIIIGSLIGVVFLVIISIISYVRYIEKKKDNAVIAREKEKSEKLLLNILPEAVANDLKENGQTIPRTFENVTVFFSDIVTFTNISAAMEPVLLISELNDLFTNFDDIIEKHSCERIKTIGDAYLAVCGMPQENPNHAENMILAAKEIIHYLNERNSTHSIQWKIRIGIHTGKVVGGVVGVKKYIYDVFGDTINTCSRMESNSLPMKINISETTYQLTRDKFTFQERKIQEVKGKGLVKMYFVES